METGAKLMKNTFRTAHFHLQISPMRGEAVFEFGWKLSILLYPDT